LAFRGSGWCVLSSRFSSDDDFKSDSDAERDFFSAIGVVWKFLIWVLKIAWKLLGLFVRLPKLVRAAWFEIVLNVPVRCEVCQSDITGLNECATCGFASHSGSPAKYKSDVAPFLKSKGSLIPLRVFDTAKRISLGTASGSVAVSLLIFSGLYIFGLVFYAIEGRSGEYFAQNNPVWFLLTSLSITLPAILALANRWLLIISLKHLLIWSGFSLFFALVLRNSVGLGAVTPISIAANFAALMIVVNVVATLVVGLFTLQMRQQGALWEEHHAASLVRRGFSGRPGASLELANFDDSSVIQGQLGEQITADRLRGSLVSKSILFNSLVDPDLKIGDLDHALLIGDQLLLIDSKRWRPGRYSVSQGNILRDGEAFPGGTPTLQAWVAHYREKFPELASVTGLVVLTNPASIIEGKGELSNDVRLASLRELQQIMDFKRATNEATPDLSVIRYFMSLVSDPSAEGGSENLELSDYDQSLLSASRAIWRRN